MSRRMSFKSMSTLAITWRPMLIAGKTTNWIRRLARKLWQYPAEAEPPRRVQFRLGKSAERSSLADDQVDVCLKPGNDQQNSTLTRRLPRGGRTEPGFSEICGLVGKEKSSRTARDQAQRPQATRPWQVEPAHPRPIPERQVATATVAVVPEVTRGDQGLIRPLAAVWAANTGTSIWVRIDIWSRILCIPLCIDVKHQLIPSRELSAWFSGLCCKNREMRRSLCPK